MWRFLFISLCALAPAVSAANADESPLRVMASIKPLQLIAAAITDGVSEPELLVPVGASPHGFTLRPSDLARLSNADVVFWMGPAMEPYLQKLVTNLPDTVAVQQFLDSAASEASGHDAVDAHGHEHSHEHSHEHGEEDLHLWLDPSEGRLIAQRMARVLGERDPANGERYRENLQRFEQGLATVIEANRARLQARVVRSLFVFHDAYGGLESFYGIEIAGAITLSPEMQPGTRHLLELRERLERAGSSCLFSEPQFQSAMVVRLLKGLDVELGELDPLAGNIPPSADGYLLHQRQMIEAIADCTRVTTQ
ncbi:zinc ABC transporter substrate-binding protein [Aestuariirhabdus sp. LZHN29]|uniref:zinc ABC transporter substrate-binding protein n=1 Tax=Aestuariirhabdus sp. LZHN29 TaxID=3417462 RepID=UPI003CF3440A